MLEGHEIPHPYTFAVLAVTLQRVTSPPQAPPPEVCLAGQAPTRKPDYPREQMIKTNEQGLTGLVGSQT